MKNQKITLVFVLIAVFLLIMTGLVQATNNSLQIELPPDANNTQQTNVENNNQVQNNVPTNNTALPTNNQTGATNNTLPQTGVTEDATLFVFITICVISAIYAFVKIKNYKNV